MSHDKRTPDERERDFVKGVVEAHEIERLVTLPKEQLDQETRDAGLVPGEGNAALEAVLRELEAGSAGEKKAAPVVQLAAWRRSRTVVAVLALAAAAALVIGITKRQEIVAYFSPAPAPIPTAPGPEPTAPPGPLPQDLAMASTLWNQAWLDCRRHYYGECQDEQKAAKQLDPDGQFAHAQEMDQALNDYLTGVKEQHEALAKRYVRPDEVPLRAAPKKGK